MPKIEKYDKKAILYTTAVQLVKQIINSTSKVVVALPTGNTSTPLYAQLTQDKTIDWSKISVFMLDCYFPQEKNDRESFYTYITTHLLDKIYLPAQNFHILNSSCANPEFECQKYEKEILKAGGLDLAILGIGLNGHIAFNEPGTPEDSLTHLTKLAPQTIKENNSDQKKSFPQYALTMGIHTIMSAKKIIVLASGSKKAQAVKDALTQPVSSQCPASFLRKHNSVTFLLDKEAAQLL